MAMAQQFDPAAFKNATRDQWNESAAAWDAWGPTLEEWLAEATATMLDLAGVTGGSRVLDVAAGAGGQSVLAARRAGPQGRVLATDISAGILELAQRRFDRSGLANAATKVMDGEDLAVEEARYDAVICRLGLMYCPDCADALAPARRALRPGGRISVVVFATPADNGFFSLPVSIVRRRAGLGPPVPGQPGPFSVGAPGVLEEELVAAGFTDVEVRAIEAPLRLPSAEQCLRFERESFGALQQILSGLAEPEREAAWAEVGTALEQFEGPDGFSAPCRLLVGAGTRA